MCLAIKKSELYSSLWSSCNELRGGMDSSQYKDYVLVILFIKYVSDKYSGMQFAQIKIPDGASFTDMVALKGSTDIGDQINRKITGPLQTSNNLSDMPDFNDATKLANNFTSSFFRLSGTVSFRSSQLKRPMSCALIPCQ